MLPHEPSNARHPAPVRTHWTQVLQDSLCGSSKVLLVCNLAPEAESAQETLSSLNFASRAAQVELGPARRATADRAPAQQQASSGGGGGTGGGGGDGSDSRAGSAASSPARTPPLGPRAPTRLGERGSPVASAGSSPRLPAGAFAKPARH
jgi:hypothetical protein